MTNPVSDPCPGDSRILDVHPRIQIPLDEFRFLFVRSSGPGGQNVNKLATKAVLHWRIVDSPSLPEDILERFVSRYSRRISASGQLTLSSQRYRTQRRNQQDCLDKLTQLLRSVADKPPTRRPTRPTRGALRRRRVDKDSLARKKQSRRGDDWRE